MTLLITDCTDLDDQLSGLFTNGKVYIGDESVISVESRDDLRELSKGRNSGGVFLTTIHKFTEDTELLTDRTNVICISDEAHRSQVNLDQKVVVDQKSGKVTKTLSYWPRTAIRQWIGMRCIRKSFNRPRTSRSIKGPETHIMMLIR